MAKHKPDFWESNPPPYVFVNGESLDSIYYLYQWGSDRYPHTLFYNLPIDGDEWDQETWSDFIESLEENYSRVEKNPDDYEDGDLDALGDVLDWAITAKRWAARHQEVDHAKETP